ncbi:MAG: 50S ribosomal protein L3 N(5)-glutamine methyltransferase [Gammaproteobacteria bacterium HGW-Gammaproteobacteria-3]|nr:MAG: 50S ribosomal protein L3 N(5)-glutamine methyltransferase [Gammaproteobacteria bacterium HGW-Gammaproteobacteria-3]
MNPPLSDVANTLATLRDYIRWGASRFNEAELCFGHGTASALDEAAAIVLYGLHQPYDLAPVYLDSVLTPAERVAVIDLIEQRIATRKPAAYLTHEALFAGLTFYVDERVLVPRSPIAELIEAQFSPWLEADAVANILDLCTGSGCIAIACALAFPNARVDALDLSDEALAVAQINIERYGLSDEMGLLKSDLFADLPAKHYDLIVSNPPYVALEEWQNLPREFHHEPAMGFKGGKTGLDLVLRILSEANKFLTERGILVIEVGSSAETLQNLFPTVPFYWLDFERGGDGVLLLTAEQLSLYTPLFEQALS